MLGRSFCSIGFLFYSLHKCPFFYHLFVLHADNPIPTEFTGVKYGQNVVDLYPQLDRDNNHSNPPASVSFGKRAPIGDVATNDLRKSITRETTDKLVKDFGYAKIIS